MNRKGKITAIEINEIKNALKYGYIHYRELDSFFRNNLLGSDPLMIRTYVEEITFKVVKTIEDNIMISNLNLVANPVIDHAKSAKITNEYIEKVKVKTPSKDQLIKNLSGGNQQKAIIARWLAQEKKVIIFDEPTRGIDVGAKREIYNLMNELVATGAAIIMISSELPEILGMSDRVMVMHEGKVANILDIKDASEERILYFATGGVNKYEQE